MPQTSKTIVFFGNERLATGVKTTAPVLRNLLENGYHVAAVVANFEPGQSRSARELEVAAVAEAHNIPLLLPKKLSEIADDLQQLGAEAGVLVAYGRIVPQSIIDLFPRGIVNIHPSLLPKHRGPTPLESVILQGEQKTGVSIMALAKNMDAGPVYAQSEVNLSGNESKQALADHLLDVGGAMLAEVLPGILDGSIVGRPQDDTQATYDQLLSKHEGQVDWNQPAEQIERTVRAYTGWPNARTTISGKDVVLTKVHVNSGPADLPIGKFATVGKEIHVGTKNGVVIIDKLKPAGKTEMLAAAFLAGNSI